MIQNLKITKFFDVKTPEGILDRNESENNYSVGVDLYMPILTYEFIKEFKKSNTKMYGEIEQIINSRFSGDKEFENTYLYSENDELLMRIESVVNRNTGKIENTKYHIIADRIQIPTGIGVLIPLHCFGEVRSKSSNFPNGYTVITGTIDMNYTYSMGVQIKKLVNEPLILESNQKIAQFVLIEAVPIMKIEEVEKSDFEKLEEVETLRKVRTGGFGSTGRF